MEFWHFRPPGPKPGGSGFLPGRAALPAGRNRRTSARRLQRCLTRRSGSSEDEERKIAMIRKLSSGKYRLYSRKADPRTGKRRNLGTFGSRAATEKHERAVQYFKHH